MNVQMSNPIAVRVSVCVKESSEAQAREADTVGDGNISTISAYVSVKAF